MGLLGDLEKTADQQSGSRCKAGQFDVSKRARIRRRKSLKRVAAF
jgi:hypothetical protein